MKSYGLEERIRFRGETKDVNNKLQHASICAMPSVSEAPPLALLEAMSMGLPSAGLTACPGINELITEDNGYLTEEDPDAYAAALKKLMTDEKLRETLGQNAKKTAAKFSPDAIQKKWEQALSDLAGDARKEKEQP